MFSLLLFWILIQGYYYNKEWGIGERGMGNAKTRNTKMGNL